MLRHFHEQWLLRKLEQIVPHYFNSQHCKKAASIVICLELGAQAAINLFDVFGTI